MTTSSAPLWIEVEAQQTGQGICEINVYGWFGADQTSAAAPQV